MHLANRWARLESMLSALNKIKNGGLDELQTLIDASVNQRLAELIDERIKKTETALNALELNILTMQIRYKHAIWIKLHSTKSSQNTRNSIMMPS